ncbi:hypothetical protein OUZ56_012909 [Daphnia magna]|uniref:Uncharacterized protein n=1 Tax=Daphnia magna TaxID=35525 RepID=A0ABQ9Z4E1_9CRUS|nr:hypothetical protein OUZ56_012909 [Daphnia magna]
MCLMIPGMWHAHVDVLVVSQEDPSVNMDRWSAGSWSVNSWKRVEFCRFDLGIDDSASAP